jgi:oligopeptide/dipeptide ABC transporter ATP-binding protein
MYLGRVVEQAPTRQLFAMPRHPYTQSLLAAAPSIDPRARREQPPLQGDVPSPSRPPPGCAFHTRCPRAQARCSQEVPALRAVASGHLAACHFAEETLP